MLPEPDRPTSKIDEIETSGDNEALLDAAREAVEQARQFDPARLPRALTTYIRLLVGENQYDRAKALAAEVLLVENRSQNASEALISLGICAAQTNQLDTAEGYFQQAADLSRQIGYSMGLARALQHLTSMVLLVRGQFHLALTLMEEAGILRDEQGTKNWNEPFLRGLIYQIVGDRRHCREVLDEMVRQVEPGTILAAAYYFLWARLSLDEEEPEQAKEYLRLALRVANRIGLRDLNLLIRLEFSHYHRVINEGPVARTWAEDAMLQAQSFDAQYFIGLALIERAQANQLSGDLRAADADLDEAFRLLTPLRAAYDLARARFLRALWHQESQQPDAESTWVDAVNSIIRDGYAFIVEKEQERAFPLIAAHVRCKTSQVRQVTESLLEHLANVLPPSLRIATLGQFAVWKGRSRIPDSAWTRRKAGELLRYLLLQSNRAAGREVIIEALWPSHPSDNPADLLHQATSALRHALEPDLPDKFPSRYLKVEGEHIALVLPPGSVVDYEQFERALPLAIQTRSADRLQEALNLYSGELFPSDRYADWSEEKRQALSELHLRGLLALAQAYLSEQQYYNAINCCRHILQLDSWNEDAVLLAMQSYAGLQDAPHALMLFKDLEKTLRKELDIRPRSDLRALADTLRKRS